MKIDLAKIPAIISIKGIWDSNRIFINNKELRPEKSISVINHSPDGFCWGYGGSGPAQLALAILLEYLPADNAKLLYQRFKFDVISAWPKSDFDITIGLRSFIRKSISEIPV